MVQGGQLWLKLGDEMSNPILDVLFFMSFFILRLKKSVIKMQARVAKSLVSFYVFICEVNQLLLNPLRI